MYKIVSFRYESVIEKNFARRTLRPCVRLQLITPITIFHLTQVLPLADFTSDFSPNPLNVAFIHEHNHTCDFNALLKT